MNRILAVVAATVSLVLAACGGATTQNITRASQPSAHAKVEVQWDGSGFDRFATLYREEVAALLQTLAVRGDDVLTVVLDGQPLTTANVKNTNFAASLYGDEVEKEEEPEIKQAMAAGLAKTLIARAKEIVPGSGQLQGLELAANTPGVTEIYQWTDGVVNEPGDHFSLTDASENRITAEIKKWQPLLKKLKDKTVVVVGVGQGVHEVITVERAHRLFRALVEGDGGHLVWTPTIGQLEG
jgi:adenosyl cobinamide kinase/adenosyl cobinamide phosphate guanylyltransferase